MKNIKRSFIMPFVLFFFAIITLSASSRESKPILFNHGLHVVENELECATCHEGIAEAESGYRSIPDHEVCESCHETEEEESCALCHLNPEDPVAIPGRVGRFEGFAHSIHNNSSLGCEKCHIDVQVSRTEPVIPAMVDCQNCHLTSNQNLNCELCHLGERPLPLDHNLSSWKSCEHGMEAVFSTSRCESCHEQNTCDECHQGSNIYGSPHPPSWVFDHFAEANWEGDCLACHETRSSCTSCHRSTLAIPHEMGPAYAGFPDGGAHVEEARSFIETCISCHDIDGTDPTCARCHE